METTIQGFTFLYLSGDPKNRTIDDYSIRGSALGSPYLRKLPSRVWGDLQEVRVREAAFGCPFFLCRIAEIYYGNSCKGS